MLVKSKYNPERQWYDFKNVMYFGDDFRNKGRLSFDCDEYIIKKYMAIFKFHPNSPKIKKPILTISNVGLISIEELKKFKTAKIIKEKDVKTTFKDHAFHLPLFIETLSGTDINFMYESKEYLDEIAIIEQHKPILFKPKTKRNAR